ncbi:MAG: anhydro-N-acetylmuramic acid kinase, partial [Rhodospirillales bacterium]|nr:anhydro-N-acetylmuramic acid kinase [Rhodospirillales bacterium]
LDRNDFIVNFARELSVEDGAATLAMFTAAAIGRALEHLPARPREWIVCGGGTNNPFLISKLNEILGLNTRRASDLGWDGEGLEAQAFAYLAVRSLRDLPFSFPTTTGVPIPMSGGRLDLP